MNVSPTSPTSVPPVVPPTPTPSDTSNPGTAGTEPRFTLTQRNLLILVIAVIAGVVACLLLNGAGIALGQAIVAGAGAFGGTLFFIDRIVT